MRTRLFIRIGLLSLMASAFLSCSKGGSDTPVVIPPPHTDSTTTNPPKDTTTTPPKDTTSTPPKDTTTLPTLTYRAMSTDINQINQVNTGQYFMKYYNSGGNKVAQMNSYSTPNGILSSHNFGTATVTTDANGTQLLTSGNMLKKKFTDPVSVTDTTGVYYLTLQQDKVITIIFPIGTIGCVNFTSAVSASTDQQVNNGNVQIEKLLFQ